MRSIGETVYKHLTIEGINPMYPGKVVYANDRYYVLEFTFGERTVRESYDDQAVVEQSNESGQGD